MSKELLANLLSQGRCVNVTENVENYSEGLLVVKKVVSELKSEITNEANAQDASGYQYAITTRFVDGVLDEIKKQEQEH